MVKWTSGKSERTLNQNAANGRKEPKMPNAAVWINGTDDPKAAVGRPWVTVQELLWRYGNLRVAGILHMPIEIAMCRD